MKHEDSEHMIKNILEDVNQLRGQRLNTFGEDSKAQSLSSTVHISNKHYEGNGNVNNPNVYIKDYQMQNPSQRQSRDISQKRVNYDYVVQSDSKSQYSNHQSSRNHTPDNQNRRQRQYLRHIRHLQDKLEQRLQNQQLNTEGTKYLKQQNSRLTGDVVRLKKELLGQQFQLRMLQTQLQSIKQQDNSNRLRQQLKIRQQYHRKQLKQRQQEREIQVDRIVRLFQSYNQDLQVYYKGIIQDQQIVVSQNVQQTLYSLKRTFNRNKNRQIDRIGMQYISTQSYQPTRLRTKSRYQTNITYQTQNNLSKTVQNIKQQLLSMNKLKQKQIQQMRNIKDKLSYLDTETEYQKVYLSLVVDLQSLRHNKPNRSNLQQQAQIIQLRSQVKILNEQLSMMRKFSTNNLHKDNNSKQSKLQKQLDILKQYIKQQNESKIKFFTDLQKTKTSNQIIYSQNTKLKKQMDVLKSHQNVMNNNSQISRDYQILDKQYKGLKEQIQHKNSKIIELEREVRRLLQSNGDNRIKQLLDQVRTKELDQMKSISNIQSLQVDILKLKAEKEELLDVIKRIGANIQTQQQLKLLLSNIERQNVHLKSEIVMLRQSMTQENIARATNEACRMITQRYQIQIRSLKAVIEKGRQEFLGLQKLNGQLVQDLRVINQQAKVKGVAVEHLWEVKNAEYENIMGQIKRLQSI